MTIVRDEKAVVSIRETLLNSWENMPYLRDMAYYVKLHGLLFDKVNNIEFARITEDSLQIF